MNDNPNPIVADAYEANIAAPGEIIHRDKLVSRALAVISLIMTLICFTMATAALIAGNPIGVPIGVGIVGLLFVFAGLTRSVLRTAVTRESLHIHWGLWGPQIPLTAITAVSVRKDYSRTALIEAMRVPGSPGVHMISVAGNGPVVDLQWKDEKGKLQRAWLGADDAPALCEAIERSAARAKERVRVARADAPTHTEDSNTAEPAEIAVSGAAKQRL